jgi:hypothetical protein
MPASVTDTDKGVQSGNLQPLSRISREVAQVVYMHGSTGFSKA